MGDSFNILHTKHDNTNEKCKQFFQKEINRAFSRVTDKIYERHLFGKIILKYTKIFMRLRKSLCKF